MMRSLVSKALVAFAVVLALCLLVVRALSVRTQHVYLDPVFAAMDRIELQQASQAWQRGGPAGVQAYTAMLNREFGGAHFLLSPAGVDLATGAGMANLLPRLPAMQSRGIRGSTFVVTQQSADGRFWLVAVSPLQSRSISFVPLYLLMCAVVIGLSLISAAYLILPLRRMADVAAQFGRGALTSRVNSHRRDELGDLARAYDRMAEQLQAAIGREQQFMQDLSHELRTPLARLRLSTRLARSEEHLGSSLDAIDRDVERLTSLVSGITELSVFEDAVGHATVFDAAAVLEKVVQVCRSEGAAKQCELHTDQNGHVIIQGTPETFRRAFENVLRNAIRHAPVASAVEVCVSTLPEGVQLSVRDYGSGVPVPMLESIFDPFFQVDTARTPGQAGLGLGLAIVRRAVAELHGTVRAENAAPGLRIVMLFPAHAEPAGSSRRT